MLKVKTYIKEVGDKGIGLFAGEFIPKGTIIWKNSILHKRLTNLDDLNEEEVNYVKTYAFMENEYWVLCIDDSKYVNHSSNPNTYHKNGNIYALRDLNNNEEILENYLNYCEYRNKFGLGFQEK